MSRDTEQYTQGWLANRPAWYRAMSLALATLLALLLGVSPSRAAVGKGVSKTSVSCRCVSCDSACCLKNGAPSEEKIPAVPSGSFAAAKDLISGGSLIFVTIRKHADVVFHRSAPSTELLPPGAPLYLRHLAQII